MKGERKLRAEEEEGAVKVKEGNTSTFFLCASLRRISIYLPLSLFSLHQMGDSLVMFPPPASLQVIYFRLKENK